MSFQRFCRLDGALHIPDARTLWSFKQRLAQGGLGGRAIFEVVSVQLQQHGYLPRGGQVVDASIVQAPITQLRSPERETLNEGKTPEGWNTKRVQHTDRDARWKLIRRVEVTPANVNDGQTLGAVLDTANTRDRLLADRGHYSAANRELLKRHRLRDGIARRAKPGQEARRRQPPHQQDASACGACVRRPGAAWWQAGARDDACEERAGHHFEVRGLQRQALGVAGRAGAADLRAEVRPQCAPSALCRAHEAPN